ncbi:MAG: hypothetical protein ABWY23_11875 [Mycetocola sp.]
MTPYSGECSTCGAVKTKLNLSQRIYHCDACDAPKGGWLGEVEGLQVRYSGVKVKLAQIDATLRRRTTATELSMPSFTSIPGKSSTS